jgi:phenylalanine-4-hydroxylase
MRTTQDRPAAIPAHLQPFIAHQDASLYTPIDHACWRFILRVSTAFFDRHAHQKYRDGLRETGISTERIPLVAEMDACLSRFGWRAVPVNGFIPPAAFMEFQSLGILPIACEMRSLDHLAYTPAPDIVHEAAGHAPILADPEYAQYLRNYGEVARRAIVSSHDLNLYEAIRALSEVKEDPASTPEQVRRAQDTLERTVIASEYVSEAAQLARMNWWTVEYGLVGSLQQPKIYGAGLLSSVAESGSCLGEAVRKLPLTLDCLQNSYDITRPQPQLYVTPDFATLTELLERVAERMAFRRGGLEGLAKAKMAAAVTTSVLDSGLQISGVLHDFALDEQNRPCFLKLSGPTQLAWGDAQVPGQGPEQHRDGFSSPIGRLRGQGRSAADLTPDEVASLDRLEFQSGIVVQGRVTSWLHRDGRMALISFADCTVSWGDSVLFRPEWGAYDLACGQRVVSVFGGAADRGAYLQATAEPPPKARPARTNLTEQNRALNALYATVRRLREDPVPQTELSQIELSQALRSVLGQLDAHHRDDWLLRLEVLELALHRGLLPDGLAAVRQGLAELASASPDRADLIARGLALLDRAES